MSSDEEKPPAPPVRLTSNRGMAERIETTVDRPLPKGEFTYELHFIHRREFHFHAFQNLKTPTGKRKR